MKHFTSILLAGCVTLFFICGVASAQGQGGPGKAPRMGCQQRFDSMDVDHDGKVTKAEFLAVQHHRGNPEQLFQSMDAAGRGYLTKDDFCSGKGMGTGRGAGQGKGMGRGAGATQ